MWWATLFNGKNGGVFRNVIYIGLIITFLVIFTIVMINVSKKNKAKKENQDKIKGYEAEIIPDKVNYSDSEFENMASVIDNSIGFFHDDEDVIYSIFMKMKSNSDLLKLQEIFGVRSAGHDLFTAIHRNLNDEEIQKINTILNQRNISIKV